MMDSSSQPVRPPSIEEPRLRSQPPPLAPAGAAFSLEDALYTLGRHKLKIILCTLLGLASAGVYYKFSSPPYISVAKLFVRYVVVEGMSMRSSPDDPVTKSPDMRGETIISSEQEIISSFDLAKQVAQAVGPEKILAKAGGGNDLNAATGIVQKGIATDAAKFSSVIAVSFTHSDPAMAQTVLREVIDQYLKKHVEIHSGAGMAGDFLNRETDQLHSKLAQTEDELRKARIKAGVVSVEDAKKTSTDQMASLRMQVFAAQAELAEREAIIKEFSSSETKESAGATTTPAKPKVDETSHAATEPEIPPAVMEEYRVVYSQLANLRRREQELLLQFTAESPRVKEVRTQIADAQSAKQQLETDNPRLARLTAPANVASDQTTKASAIDLKAEQARKSALQAKIKSLNDQQQTLRAEAANLDLVEGTINELMRRKQLEETNYRHYAASLEQSRINEALNSGRVSNISQIQAPSPAAPDLKKTMKVTGGIAASGLFAGLAWAFLIDLVLDRSVRRASDVEKTLRLPLLISIPRFSGNMPRRRLNWKRKAISNRSAANGNTADVVAADADQTSVETESHFGDGEHESDVRPFHETLRDRLIAHFERRNLTHKPKLIAVTGLNLGAGVTTTSAGLARCMSETGDGNVLLVDLAPGQASARQFCRGNTVCSLEEVFTVRSSAQVQDKLFVASDASSVEQLSRILPGRFKHLVPRLKASDFDYIIFDLPPVSEISVTPRLAGFMDMVILVIESGVTDRNLVQRAMVLLAESKAFVGALLNKTEPGSPHKMQLLQTGSAYIQGRAKLRK